MSRYTSFHISWLNIWLLHWEIVKDFIFDIQICATYSIDQHSAPPLQPKSLVNLSLDPDWDPLVNPPDLFGKLWSPPKTHQVPMFLSSFLEEKFHQWQPWKKTCEKLRPQCQAVEVGEQKNCTKNVHDCHAESLENAIKIHWQQEHCHKAVYEHKQRKPGQTTSRLNNHPESDGRE